MCSSCRREYNYHTLYWLQEIIRSNFEDVQYGQHAFTRVDVLRWSKSQELFQVPEMPFATKIE
jgi:hypothetical protein